MDTADQKMKDKDASSISPAPLINAASHMPGLPSLGRNTARYRELAPWMGSDTPRPPHHPGLVNVAAPAEEELVFVHVTDQPRPPEYRKVVRSHVMRRHRRQRNLKESREAEACEKANEINKSMADSPYHSHHGNPQIVAKTGWMTHSGRIDNSEQPLPTMPSSVHSLQDSWHTSASQNDVSIEDTARNDMTLQANKWTIDGNTCVSTKGYFAGPSSQIVHKSHHSYGPYLVNENPVSQKRFSWRREGPQVDEISFWEVKNVDPFDTLPLPGSPRLQLLVKHYNEVLVKTLLAINPRGQWFNYAITDTALFQATMLHSSAHYAFLHGDTDLSECFHLRKEAVRLVKEKVEDPVHCISDTTIGIVACLALFENQVGNIGTATIHINGLEQMTKLRGGLDNLGFQGMLRNKLIWADLCNATQSFTEPRFSHVQTGGLGSQLLQSFSNQPETIGYRDISPDAAFLEELHGCDERLMQLFLELRPISIISTLPQYIDAIEIDGISYSDRVSLIERQVMILINSNASSQNQSSIFLHIELPCYLAALLYIYIALRDFPAISPFVGTFVGRLMTVLVDTDLVSVWEKRYLMLIWMLVIGASSASEYRCKQWFVSQLAILRGPLGIQSFESMTSHIECGVWPRGREIAFRNLWNEIESCQL